MHKTDNKLKFKNIAQAFFQRDSLDLEVDCVMYKVKLSDSHYTTLSVRQFQSKVKSIFAALKSNSVVKNTACAIYSSNCLDWVACDIAALCNGAFTVPIYPTSSISDIDYILENSEAQYLFVQNEKFLKKIIDISSLKNIKKIIIFEEFDINSFGSTDLKIESLDSFIKNSSSLDNVDIELDKAINQIELNDLATVIYTSGTTGQPKGVCLTHRNILSVLKSFEDIIPITQKEVYLSYLPLSHVFERICGEFYWLYSGGVFAFAQSVDTVGKNLAEINPSMLLVVPRVLEFIATKALNNIKSQPTNRRKLIEWALEVGKQYFYHVNQPAQPSLLLKLKHFIAQKLVLSKIRAKISTRLRLVVSGGASGSISAIEFFNAIGIKTIEGYGLTETAAPVTVNLTHFNKLGTVGPAIPGVELKLDSDNEILVRGDSIFSQYHKNPEATAQVIDSEGWFRTGDIGMIDKDGYLKICDRKKDLIVNSAGKNIAPQKIENALRQIPIISQAVVFGDKQKYLAALITLNSDVLNNFLKENNIVKDSNVYSNSILLNYIKKEIKKVSTDLADYEVVKKFFILENDLSIEGSELTATMKIKRNIIAKKYCHIIESLFCESESQPTKSADSNLVLIQ